MTRALQATYFGASHSETVPLIADGESIEKKGRLGRWIDSRDLGIIPDGDSPSVHEGCHVMQTALCWLAVGIHA